jgi:LysR family transcriptional regulator, transcriptional activator of nhaA
MNYKHLHYFWVTAKAGGIVRAGAQLNTTPQTLSSQIKLLEERLGRPLFRKSGRRLELTDEGRVALSYADDIFALGGDLEARLRQDQPGSPQVELRVGVADSVSKLVAYRLLEPALELGLSLHLSCHEGKFTELLGQLALHKLDLVLADEPLPRKVSIKAFNHALGQSAMSFFAAPSLKARLKGRFPVCLNNAPMLLQGPSSAIRPQLEAWLSRHQLHPRLIAEFDDGALMNAFGRQGRGVFTAPSVLESATCEQYNVEVLGRSDELVEEFFAISVERRITHPGVAAITQAARDRLFGR